MGLETVFLVIAGILFIGFLGEIVFERTKIPDVIWLLFIGILLGSVLKWATAATFADVAPYFTTFALIFLLFEAGINIDIKKFLKSAPQGLKLSILSFIFSFIIIFLLGLLLQKGVLLSLLLGAILAGISSAVVIPIIRNLNISGQTQLSLFFDSAFSDVLCILGVVTIIEIFTASSVTGVSVLNRLLSSFLIAILVGMVFAFAWNRYFITKIKSHPKILTLAIMLVVYAITEIINANGAIACLVFGLVLGNTKKIADVFSSKKDQKSLITKSGKEFYSEIAFFIKTFFFVYLGVLINFSDVWSFVLALVILIALYAARPFAVFLSFGKETKLRDVKILETLIPKGLAAAVLVQLPIQAGIRNAGSLVNVVLAVILLSIVASTFFVYLIQKNKYEGAFKFLYRKYKN